MKNVSVPFAVSLRGVSKEYRRGPEVVHALENASLTLVPGEVVALVGPSGSGKTTLLNILAGWEERDGGEIEWGFDGAASNAAGHPWRRVAVLPQSLGLLEELSVRENVELPIRMGTGENGTATARAQALLEELGLARFSHRPPAEVSIGEQQRTALARALVLGPRILLADEPSGHQDAVWAEGVWRQIHVAAGDGTSCLVATHNEELLPHADRIVGIRDGHLHEVSSIAELHAR